MSKQKKVSKKAKTVAKQQPKRRLLPVRVHLGVAALLLLFVFLVAPVRNAIAGTFVKRDVSLVITETRTGEVVQDAVVTIGSAEYKTSDTGSVILKDLRPGTHTATIEKPFYESTKIAVQVSAVTSPRQVRTQIEAKGRLTKVIVKNKLSGLPVHEVNIKTDGGSYARTNERGEATVVLQFAEQQTTATVSGETIATKTAIIRPAQDALTNLIEVMPAGRMVYLSGSAQTPDVTSVGLDGNDVKQIIAASGFEEGSKTQLFPHVKQQWAVLHSKRDGGVAMPRLLHTTTGELVPMVTDNALYTPVGWINDAFVYRAKTNTGGQFYTETEELRAYDMQARTTEVLYTTRWEGTSSVDYAQERIGEVYNMSNAVYFETSWRASYYYGSRLADKKMTISYIDAEQQVSVLQDWPAGYNASIRSVKNKPNRLIVFAQLDGVKNTFWEVSKDVSVESAILTPADFTNKQYPTYVVSPNGVSTIWKGVSEQERYVFIGDSSATSVRVFSTDQSYATYAWYNDDYVFLQKNSDIYIIGRGGVKDRVVPVRIVSDAAAPL
jgi:hypothetical protein